MEIIFTCIWMKVGDIFSLVFILNILCIRKGRNLSYKGRYIIGPTANSIDLITFRSIAISFNKESIIRRHITDKTTVPLWRKEPGLQAQHLLLCNKTIFCWIYNWYSLRGLSWWLSGKNWPANTGDDSLIFGRADPLEKEMVTHSSIPAWEIPWTEGVLWATFSPWGRKRVWHG